MNPSHLYQLPDLPYDFSALEPFILGKIMELHYLKHHQAYVTNLNSALEKYRDAESKNDLPGMVALQPAIRFNGGGHINHSIFWTNLAPVGKGGGELPKGELAQAVQQEWGSIEKLIEKMSAMAVAIPGSGWAWLVLQKGVGRLGVVTCPNQDPLNTQEFIPLLGLDVWEHAYYLQYQNVRAEYVKNFWKVVHWKNVEERFSQGKK